MVLYMYLQARARADESLSAMLLQKRNFDKITNKMKTQGLLLKNLQSVVAAYKKSSSKLTKVIQGESESYEFGIFSAARISFLPCLVIVRDLSRTIFLISCQSDNSNKLRVFQPKVTNSSCLSCFDLENN